MLITAFVYIHLLWQTRCQYTTIWYDDMSTNNGGWSYRSSSYTSFGFSSGGCASGTCCITNGGKGSDEWAVRSTDISSYSYIRLQVHISTYMMYSGSTCDVYYSYTSSSTNDKELVLTIDPPDSSSGRYSYPDQVIDLPYSPSANTVWIWLYSNSPSSTQTDYCVWDDVYLKGISAIPSTVATSDPTKRPTEPPTRVPTEPPTRNPTAVPSRNPTAGPSQNPTVRPTVNPTLIPTRHPSSHPTGSPIPTPKPTTSNPSKSIVAVVPTTSSTVLAEGKVQDTTHDGGETTDGGEGDEDDVSGDIGRNEDGMLWTVMADNWLAIIALVSVLICCMCGLAIFILTKSFKKRQQEAKRDEGSVAATSDRQTSISNVNSSSAPGEQVQDAKHGAALSDSFAPEDMPGLPMDDMPDADIDKERMHVPDDSFGGIAPGSIEEVMEEDREDGEDGNDGNADIYNVYETPMEPVENEDGGNEEYVCEAPIKLVEKDPGAMSESVAQCANCGEVREGKTDDDDGQFYCNQCWAQLQYE